MMRTAEDCGAGELQIRSDEQEMKVVKRALKLVVFTWKAICVVTMILYSVPFCFAEGMRYMMIWHDGGPELTRRLASTLLEESRKRHSAWLRYAAKTFYDSYRKKTRE